MTAAPKAASHMATAAASACHGAGESAAENRGRCEQDDCFAQHAFLRWTQSRVQELVWMLLTIGRCESELRSMRLTSK